ncbi:MAG: hypothetical protein MUE58_09410 [Chitinophagaceae bacterium]|nr:hypothetical protein [Chitinophagaceae bacterium]
MLIKILIQVMRTLVLLLLIPVLLILVQCTTSSEDTLLNGFSDPPAEARPFVRWWWNGNRITEKEITRQLDVFKKAGIGGIEINPIAIPEEADTSGTRALKWLSPEWNKLLAYASNEASERGLITDLIVGSGWPFGGEFLKKDDIGRDRVMNEFLRKNEYREVWKNDCFRILVPRTSKNLTAMNTVN